MAGRQVARVASAALTTRWQYGQARAALVVGAVIGVALQNAGPPLFAGAAHRAAGPAAAAQQRRASRLGRRAEGHQVPKSSAVSPENVDPEILAFREHQQGAARISHAEEARTLVASATSGVLSTISGRPGTEGYPSGSVVFFAADQQGRPIFSFSAMSGHTVDLKKNDKASLTILAPGFATPADARVTLTGIAAPVSDEEKEAVRKVYKAKHPNAFWTDFGDFKWHRLEVHAASLVGGFARAGSITAEEFNAAQADPVAQFSVPIAEHMNDDHGETVLAIVKGTTGLKTGLVGAKLLTVDRLGMTVLVEKQNKAEGADKPTTQSLKVRVPWLQPAESRKDIKDRIVELTRRCAEVAASEPAPTAA